MRLPRRRNLRMWSRGKMVHKLTQGDRQRLSFFVVILFLAIFGLIVLAEVLLMEDNVTGSRSDFLYEDDSSSALQGAGISWETPKPILPNSGPSLVRREMSAISMSASETLKPQNYPPLRDEKLQKSLLKHQQEMEKLIKNISARINHMGSDELITTSTEAPVDVSLDNDENALPDFDFSLQHHKGYDAVWQPVAGTSHKFFVYSAYHDTRGPRPYIRVIGATKTKRSDKVWCRLYYKNMIVITVTGSISIIRENWNLKYSACFVICILPNDQKTSDGKLAIPESVSVIALPQTPTSSSSASDQSPPPPPMPTVSNQLPVHNALTGGTGSTLVNASDVGVCVKPIHFDYDKTLEIIEFIELNKILGVTKFTFYNHTMSQEVNCVLRHYIKEGAVTVLPWNLNMVSQREIRTEGLFAALNDCLYRNMNDFKYLMLIDFDEFIIPHTNDTLPEMLKYLEQQKVVLAGRRVSSKKTSSYSFQNAFFYLQFPDDEESQNWPSLRVLRKTRRKTKFNPQKQRSKYICIPRNVKEAGNHFIWEYAEGHNVNVPTSIGFLHHYRVCEFGGDDCVHTESKVDRTIFRYRSLLVKNVEKVVQKLSSSCHLEKLQAEMSREVSPESKVNDR